MSPNSNPKRGDPENLRTPHGSSSDLKLCGINKVILRPLTQAG